MTKTNIYFHLQTKNKTKIAAKINTVPRKRIVDPLLVRQREEMMKMSVDEESCPSCDIFVTMQFRSEDSVARSVAVRFQDIMLCALRLQSLLAVLPLAARAELT